MLVKNISSILIWSEDFRALSDWYKEKFELVVDEELNHPDDTGVLFLVGNTYLWIGQHSEVHGKNMDMHRIMYNFVVDSVQSTYETLVAKGVQFYAKPFKAPTMDKYFATFLDLDGNMGQIVGPK
ncbi:MAG: VOC family protein [Candidatus Levyibacteriota bacterium]